jgi:hypothetical protein
MKQSLLIFALFILFALARPAQAQWVYGLSDTGPDYQSSVVFGLTYLEEDYYSFLYNDTYVEGYLFENSTQVDAFSAFGSNISYVITGAPGHGNSTYSQIGKHWLVAHYSDPGLGWYDAWGFSLYGGDYGYSYTWEGRPPTYVILQFIFLGATIAQRVFDSNLIADVTLVRVTPAGPLPNVTPGSSLTFTAEVQTFGGNASGNVGVTAMIESNPNGVTFDPNSVPKTTEQALSGGRASIPFTINSTGGRGPVIFRFAVNSAPPNVGISGTPINVSVCYGMTSNGLCQ